MSRPSKSSSDDGVKSQNSELMQVDLSRSFGGTAAVHVECVVLVLQFIMEALGPDPMNGSSPSSQFLILIEFFFRSTTIQ